MLQTASFFFCCVDRDLVVMHQTIWQSRGNFIDFVSYFVTTMANKWLFECQASVKYFQLIIIVMKNQFIIIFSWKLIFCHCWDTHELQCRLLTNTFSDSVCPWLHFSIDANNIHCGRFFTRIITFSNALHWIVLQIVVRPEI